MCIRDRFIIVLDSFGIGEMPDAARFGDVGSNTLGAIVKSPKYHTPTLQKLSLIHISMSAITAF